jgi:GTP-binding protein EngB required for normal cell division
VPTIVALTKTDKLSKKATSERAAEIAGALSLDNEQVILFSAHSGAGRVELLEAIIDLAESGAGAGPA